jgi:hypothetical protein
MIRLLMPLAICGALLVAGAANAQPGQDEVRKACMADYQKLCATVLPGGGRVIKCMRAHTPQLSATCKAAIVKYDAANPPPAHH